MSRNFLQFKIIGAKELTDNLAELPLATQKNVVDRALKRAAEPMRKDAQKGSRRSVKKGRFPRILTGKKVTAGQRKDARRNLKPGDRTIYIGVRPSPVAHLIELGTRRRRTKAGANRGRMTPRPYMEPAFDADWRPTLDSLGRILGEEIEKAAARLARKRARAGAK